MPPAQTFLFIGVTTAHSSSRRMWPGWMAVLGRPEVQWEGVDLPLHAPPQAYRAVVERIRRDPNVLGALVTTHKIDLLAAARDLFDRLTPAAAHLGEVSAIYKRGGRLMGHATDPDSGGRALDDLLGPGYFGRTGGHVLCLGAGGAAAALALHLLEKADPADRPARAVVVNRSRPRLDRLAAMVDRHRTFLPFTYLCNEEPAVNDELAAALPPASLVINATGLGKDRPGSPLSDAALFPQEGVAWDLNYRGDLLFLRQAQAQTAARRLTVEDGWRYFLYGWAAVGATVLDQEIDAATFARLTAIAEETR